MKWLWTICGKVAESRRDFDKAVVFFEKARNLERVARAHEQAGRFLEAMRIWAEREDWREAARLALAAGDVPAAASFYRRAGDDEQALKVLRENGQVADAVTLLIELGRTQEAAVLAEEHGDLRRAAALWLELGEGERAINLYRKLNDLRALLSAYLKQGRLQEAADECRRVGQLALAASLFESAGRFLEAAEICEEGGEHARAAELFLKAHEFEKAGQAFEKAGWTDKAVEALSQARGCEIKVAELYEKLIRVQQVQPWTFDAPVVALGIAAKGEAVAYGLQSRQLHYADRQFRSRWHWRPEGEGTIREIALSSDGCYVAVAVDAVGAGEHRLVVFDKEKKILFDLKATEPVRGVVFLPGDPPRLVAGVGNRLTAWTPDGEKPWEFDVDFCAWESMLAPSGTTLAVGSLGGTLYILDLNGALLASQHFDDRVHHLAFHSAEAWVAAAIGDRQIAICEIPSLRIMATLSTAEPVRSVAVVPFAPESLIVVGTQRVDALDVKGGRSTLITTEVPITVAAADPLDFSLYLATSDKQLTKYQVSDCKLAAAEWYLKGGALEQAAKLFEVVGAFDRAYELFRQLGDYERAASNIQRVGDNRTAARHYELVGRFDRAARLYEDMGERGRAAKCYGNAGEFLKAAALYEQLGETLLAAEFYEQAGDTRKAGYLFHELRQDERAAANWEQWVKDHPDDAPVVFELAKIYAATARHNDAIRLLQTIQEVPEFRREALRLMAECFIEKGLYEVAADRLLEALGPQWKAQRDNLDLIYDLGMAYERAGRLEEAKDLYSKIIAVDYYYRDVLEKLQKTRERITLSRQETQLDAVAAGAASGPADPFGATVATKVEKESLRYKIIKKLGQGGMGVVYLALDTRLGRYVAWKVLPAHLAGNPEFQKRLLQEACAIAQVSHPHIVAVYDVVTKPDECFLTMEYVDGPSLRELISREKQIPLGRALRYAAQMASALEAAHRANIIHRDVKPENVMIAAANDAVKMVDFGLARLAEDAHLTRDGCVVGTVSYMAPEQISGEEIDGHADIYALGVVIFEMVAGRPPFTGQNILAQHLHVPPPALQDLVPEVPTALSQLVERCLAKKADERPQRAGEVQKELEAIAALLQETQITTPPTQLL